MCLIHFLHDIVFSHESIKDNNGYCAYVSIKVMCIKVKRILVNHQCSAFIFYANTDATDAAADAAADNDNDDDIQEEELPVQ